MELPQPTLDALTLTAFLQTDVEFELLESLLPLINPDAPPVLTSLQPAEQAN